MDVRLQPLADVLVTVLVRELVEEQRNSHGVETLQTNESRRTFGEEVAAFKGDTRNESLPR